jgi:hypothetical protein
MTTPLRGDTLETIACLARTRSCENAFKAPALSTIHPPSTQGSHHAEPIDARDPSRPERVGIRAEVVGDGPLQDQLRIAQGKARGRLFELQRQGGYQGEDAEYRALCDRETELKEQLREGGSYPFARALVSLLRTAGAEAELDAGVITRVEIEEDMNMVTADATLMLLFADRTEYHLTVRKVEKR